MEEGAEENMFKLQRLVHHQGARLRQFPTPCMEKLCYVEVGLGEGVGSKIDAPIKISKTAKTIK